MVAKGNGVGNEAAMVGVIGVILTVMGVFYVSLMCVAKCEASVIVSPKGGYKNMELHLPKLDNMGDM